VSELTVEIFGPVVTDAFQNRKGTATMFETSNRGNVSELQEVGIDADAKRVRRRVVAAVARVGGVRQFGRSWWLTPSGCRQRRGILAGAA
jgi:hypothetical protein